MSRAARDSPSRLCLRRSRSERSQQGTAAAATRYTKPVQLIGCRCPRSVARVSSTYSAQIASARWASVSCSSAKHYQWTKRTHRRESITLRHFFEISSGGTRANRHNSNYELAHHPVFCLKQARKSRAPQREATGAHNRTVAFTIQSNRQAVCAHPPRRNREAALGRCE